MFWVKFMQHILPAGMHEHSKESQYVSNKLLSLIHKGIQGKKQ